MKTNEDVVRGRWDAERDHLTPDQIDLLRRRLLVMRDEQCGRIGEHLAMLDALHRGDRLDDGGHPAATRELVRAERAVLHEVDDALSKMTHDVYGRCEGCRGAIAYERLEIIPHTRRCLACQRHPTGIS